MDPRRLEIVFFVALFALAIFLSWLIFQPYVSVLILAGTLAFLFQPMYKSCLRAFRYESLTAMFVVIVVALIVFVPLGLFGLRIFGEASGLYTSLTANGGFDFGGALMHFFQTDFPNLHVPQITLNFNDSVKQGLSWLLGNFGSFFSSVATAFFTAFLSLLGLFYFLKDGERFKKWFIQLIPLSSEYTEGIVHQVEAVLSSVIKGTLVMAVIQGIVVGIGFWIFHIPNPAFWGALTVLATLVPIVGTWLVVVPAVGYLFFTDQTTFAIGLAIWSIILVNLIYNLVAPQLMRRGADIHPYVILLSVLGGIAVFGPIGFIAGPLVMALLVSLLDIYPKFVAVRKPEIGRDA
jgi:predicted PurR-regulated permease PerM